MWPAKLFVFGLICCVSLSITNAITTPTYLSNGDRARLKQVFDSAWSLNELPSIHYAILGYKLLGEKIPKQNEICSFLTNSLKSQQTSPENLYYIAAGLQSTCPGNLPKDQLVKSFTDVVTRETSSVSDLYYSILGLKSINQQIPQVPKVVKAVQTALKKDDSISNLGYSLHIASHLGAEGDFAFLRIEDAIVQADEVDGKFLQFEGGLSITALVISGAYNLATAVNKIPPISDIQIVKFSNYFLSRRSVQTAKGAYSLLNVISILTKNKFHTPVSLSIVGGAGKVSSENPNLSVQVSDLLGNSLPHDLILTLDSATKASDGSAILSNKKFTQTSNKMVQSINMVETKPEAGVYNIIVSARFGKEVPNAGKLIGNLAVSMSVRIMATAALPEPLLIGTADSDQTTPPKFHKVTQGQKLKEILEIDPHQKLVMRFTLKDKTTNKPVQVHQAFVRLSHVETGQEVIFVTERDSSNNYKLDLDVGAKSTELGYLSGLYNMELLVGDVILVNPFSWHLADVTLKFPKVTKEPVHSVFAPKPEIRHLFREPERRPPVFVSNLFTGLVLLPLLILVILWACIGVNISNFPFSLSALGFHLGLGCIFALFGLFWLQLNMFETLKYLIALGVVTFLCGNKLLAHLALQHKQV